MRATDKKLMLLEPEEARLRVEKLRRAMSAMNMEAGLVATNAAKYYLTGRVFTGYILITPDEVIHYVRRPVELDGDSVVYIRKPEEIELKTPFKNIGIEIAELPYLTAMRLAKVFGETNPANLSAAISEARSVKTDLEIEMLKVSGEKQDYVYRHIPRLYRNGMTDLEFQIEIERASRLAGCLGQFRISGDSMELFMGNVLAGENADSPSPYDFAMGGAGTDPSLPVGADGTIIEPGMTVMVDVNGNYTGYMTDMTRVFRLGSISDKSIEAHRCSIEIHRELQRAGLPGEKASVLYEIAYAIAEKHGLREYFMGHRQHAGFIGHGVGIEINELPVIAPRSKDIIKAGNVIALEPKFVIPGTGAVGIENTYVVREHGWECITNAPEDIIELI